MNPREAGLAAAERNDWSTALLLLNQAARRQALDLVTLDALGEAAYRTGAPEALSPYQNHFKYPRIATQMARAFLMLGDEDSCREFLGYASDSALKFALYALLRVGKADDLKETAKIFFDVAENYPHLYYPEFWRALAAIANAAKHEGLTKLAERRSKGWAYKDPNIHFNQALRMLGHGELRAGWRLYEWRLVPGAHQANRTELGTMAHWEGENLQGKSLLIYLEQGLGDGIFSLRYIQPLQARGARIEVVARGPLISLVKASFPDVLVHAEEEAVVTDYWQRTPQPDFWVYALSIPYRGSLWRPIGTEGFIRAPEDRLQQVREELRLLNPQLLPVVTINWHGRIDTESDRTRAFKVEEFINESKLLERPCLIVSVQKEASASDIAWLRETVAARGGAFHHAGPELKDFGDTAAWISLSERLWTNDTSVAHVGAALGHPTTVLVRNKSIWQWIPRESMEDTGIGRSLWYDSVELRFALTPEVSWLFAVTKRESQGQLSKNPNNHQDHQNHQAQLNNGKELNDEPKESELQSDNLQPSRQRRAFRFAGRKS